MTNNDDALPPVALTCAQCGNVWESTGRVRSNPACPACGKRHPITRAERPMAEAESDAQPSGDALAWDSSEPLSGDAQTPADGQPTEYPCPTCGQPTVWAGARAGIRCPAGHTNPSPGALNRASARLAAKVRAERRKASASETPEPAVRSDTEIKASLDFKVARGQYEAHIKTIARDYANWLNDYPDFPWVNNCIDSITRLTAMLSEVSTVKTITELGNVQRVIGSDLSQIDNNRSNIERSIVNLRRNREINSQPIMGEIVSDETDSPRAITAGGSQRRPDGYVKYDDDDEYDDGEYVSGHVSSAAAFKIVLIIGAFIAVGMVAKSIMDTEVPRKCDGKHIGIAPPAKERIYGYTGQPGYITTITEESRYSCGRAKCTEPMIQYFANFNWTPVTEESPNGYIETRRERFKRKHYVNPDDSV